MRDDFELPLGLSLVPDPGPEQVSSFEVSLAAPDGRTVFVVGDGPELRFAGVAAVAPHGQAPAVEESSLAGLASWMPAPTGAKATVATVPGPHSHDVARLLLQHMLHQIATEIDHPIERNVELWTSGASTAEIAALTEAGYFEERKLYQLRVPLPLYPTARKSPPSDGFEWRPFVVGQDEEGFLAVNRRAFAWHPEQGDMTRADLDQAIGEPWFDASRFVIHPVTGQIDGFCWTKIHPATTAPAVCEELGEIYVIAVDPDAAGRGIGRHLVDTGLELLHRAGITTGMLYVEADNEAAVGLYRSMGFVEHHADQRFARR